MIIIQSTEENMRSMKMFVSMNSKFQCANTTCLPFIIIIPPNVLGCQVACLMRSQCKAATFYRSIMIYTDATSMSVISGTRFPSASTQAYYGRLYNYLNARRDVTYAQIIQ
ncbi:unnamed protein product [Adineta ricciae]|uniref:Apple domain-containing protein n=1 Tax=Adineta ricciae TaxID=249248 RepID=A0A815H490_ADIRI|nr:unnamed protein product [Adineta ricciae]